MSKPNCYKCKYRRKTVGSVHSRCIHPSLSEPSADEVVTSILAGVGRVSLPAHSAMKDLNITARQHGIDKGWFIWPFNFDPVWLETCDGFAEKE